MEGSLVTTLRIEPSSERRANVDGGCAVPRVPASETARAQPLNALGRNGFDSASGRWVFDREQARQTERHTGIGGDRHGIARRR